MKLNARTATFATAFDEAVLPNHKANVINWPSPDGKQVEAFTRMPFAAENPQTVYDLNATLLHLLGLDHKRLTYRYSGRDFRLTDVSGEVIKAVLA